MTEDELGNFLCRYGEIYEVWIKPDTKKAYGFVNFRNAADADAAVVDENREPWRGQHRLQTAFADKSNDDESEQHFDPCKLNIQGLGPMDSDDEVGSFLSQWGLVAYVQRPDPSKQLMDGFVVFSTKQGTRRLLGEPELRFKGRALRVERPTAHEPINEAERREYTRRAMARHMLFRQQQRAPPMPAGGPGMLPPVGGAAVLGGPPPLHFAPGGLPPGMPMVPTPHMLPPGWPMGHAPPPDMFPGFVAGMPPPFPADAGALTFDGRFDAYGRPLYDRSRDRDRDRDRDRARRSKSRSRSRDRKKRKRSRSRRSSRSRSSTRRRRRSRSRGGGVSGYQFPPVAAYGMSYGDPAYAAYGGAPYGAGYGGPPPYA